MPIIIPSGDVAQTTYILKHIGLFLVGIGMFLIGTIVRKEERGELRAIGYVCLFGGAALIVAVIAKTFGLIVVA